MVVQALLLRKCLANSLTVRCIARPRETSRTTSIQPWKVTLIKAESENTDASANDTSLGPGTWSGPSRVGEGTKRKCVARYNQVPRGALI